MKYKQFNLWLSELNINDTKYFWPAFLTRAPPPTITSFKPTSPNRFSRTPRKTHVVWKSHILRLMKSLKSESCSSLTISTALGYMAWSKTKLVVVRFVVFHSLHLSWGAFYGRQISNVIFFSGCFWSFTQKPLPCLDDLFFTAFLMPQYTANNVFMLWHQVVQLIKIILQELNWQWVWSMFTFDVWLKLLWERLKWATLLKVQKCWYYPMKFMFTLLEGLFHWFRIKWHFT